MKQTISKFDPDMDSTADTTEPLAAKALEDQPKTMNPTNLRAPERFGEKLPEEPNGSLVQWNEAFRTYEMSDGSYKTVIGGFAAEQETQLVETVKEESGLTAERSDTARKERRIYENQSGPGQLHVELPKQMRDGYGLNVGVDGYAIKLIPASGDYTRSTVVGNAVRYQDVLPDIDVQYTITGHRVKEDILILKPTGNDSFSYWLETDGLQAAAKSDSIVIYDQDKDKPVLTLTAPFMQDAAGAISMDLTFQLEELKGRYFVRLQADHKWLMAPEREYPIRIDPTIIRGVDEGFKAVSVCSTYPNQNFSWNKPTYVGYDDGSRTGNNPGYGNCRTYFALERDPKRCGNLKC